jgi:4-amino-4-deoxy-L-arabinose transferase-like glycosyltransferase
MLLTEKHSPLQTACLIALTILCYFAIFWRLDAYPLDLYDESRQAVNALEMAMRGNFWTVTYDGHPELWNTKPPLLLWLINCSTFLFGDNLIALRLPTALAGLATVFIVFNFVKKETGNFYAGYISAIVLASSWGFIGRHSARTADYDALMALWITLYAIHIYKYLIAKQNGRKHILWAGFFILLAILTKGIGGLLPLPGMVLFAIATGKTKKLFANKWVYILGAATITLAVSYYIIRDSMQPGYIQAVFNNELGGRFNGVQEEHSEVWYYYFDKLFSETYTYYLHLLVVAIVVGIITTRRKAQFSLFTFALFTGLTHLLIITIAETKLIHYTVPEYPFYAMAIGVVAGELLQGKKWVKTATLAAVITLFILSAYSATEKIYSMSDGWGFGFYGTFLHKLEKERPAAKNLKGYTIGHGGYNSIFDYYRLLFTNKGYTIDKVPINYWEYEDTSHYAIGDTVFSCDGGIINYVGNTYTIDTILTDPHCMAGVLTGFKNDSLTHQ